ncbi:MAG: hypothetical protein KC549_09285 [Myxococcales bacterium]|nr:hypothetical protein [Myxococcales bacterium]MCB9549749.1 hypothetical protein [Myxococcales bacterium]
MNRWLSLLPLALVTGCGLTEDLASIDGVVRDPQGRPVANAVVRVYPFSRNLEYFSSERADGNRLDANTYRARVNIERLDAEEGREDRVAGIALTGPDGRYSIPDLPGDALIVVASKGGASKAIAGMDLDDGTVSLRSALSPVVDSSDGGDGLLGTKLRFRANFVMEVPPEDTAPTGPGGGVTEADPLPPEELTPPAEPITGRWESFIIEDALGNVLADASSDEALIEADLPIVRDGGAIRIRGRFSDPSVSSAFVRVQQGSSQCEAEGLEGKVTNIEVKLVNGVITSSEGDFQNWFLSGAVERYQLDLDTESENGNESELVRVDTPCVVDTSPMTITLMWDQDNVDVDLYVWNFNQEETYQGSYYDGQRGRSSYGAMEVWDNEGRGPEVFKLNAGQSGRFCVRAHVFCGPPVDTRIKARIQHWKNGAWQDKIFDGVLSRSQEWIDIGIFAVDPME